MFKIYSTVHIIAPLPFSSHFIIFSLTNLFSLESIFPTFHSPPPLSISFILLAFPFLKILNEMMMRRIYIHMYIAYHSYSMMMNRPVKHDMSIPSAEAFLMQISSDEKAAWETINAFLDKCIQAYKIILCIHTAKDRESSFPRKSHSSPHFLTTTITSTTTTVLLSIHHLLSVSSFNSLLNCFHCLFASCLPDYLP